MTARIRVLLNPEGWKVGKKLVYRLYQGLTLRAATELGGRAGPRSLAHGPDATTSTAWVGAPFRPRCAICFAGLHRITPTTRHSYQHEPIGNAVRQCPSREFHQD